MPPALGSGTLDGLHYIFFLSYQLGEETTNATLTWALLQPREQLGIVLYCDVWALSDSDGAGRGLQILHELHDFWIHPDMEAQATYNGMLEAAAADANHPVHGRRLTMYDYYRVVQHGFFFPR